MFTQNTTDYRIVLIELKKFIKSLKSNSQLITYDEASTKQVVVLKLLSLLGWDPFNISEITPEYAVGKNRVDYALQINNKICIFIEVKRIQEDLEFHQEQLLKYAFQEGIKLAVLTNGITWWLYLPLQEGSWQQRKFYSVDILQQKTDDITDAFNMYLSKQNILSGDSIKKAEELIKSYQKKIILKSNLPIAWNNIISEPDEILVELMEETTEKICGFRPDPDEVIAFLNMNLNNISISLTSKGELNKLEKSDRKTTVQYSLKNDFQRKEIKSFTFLGANYKISKWKELLVKISEIIYHSHKNTFSKAFSLRGTKRDYFSDNSKRMREPVEINNSGMYAETHWSANDLVKISKKLIVLFGYNESDLQIELGSKLRKQKKF